MFLKISWGNCPVALPLLAGLLGSLLKEPAFVLPNIQIQQSDSFNSWWKPCDSKIWWRNPVFFLVKHMKPRFPLNPYDFHWKTFRISASAVFENNIFVCGFAISVVLHSESKLYMRLSLSREHRKSRNHLRLVSSSVDASIFSKYLQ